MTDTPRTILHVDLDAFYAAVEVREDPALAGRPIVVGADPRGGRGRGVVAASSYEARAFGIHSAMPISQAYRRCPDAIYLRPRMRLYAAVSARFMAILERYTDLLEPLSIDEAFLDVTASRALFGDGAAIARRIKDEVRAEEGITASIGVAPSKFLAKIASDLRKPDGLVVVPADGVAAFLAELPVQRLWGAGPKSMHGFRQLGATTIGAVARLPRERLLETFGESLGAHFHALARGEDPRAVVPDRRRKSVGHETTFLEDVRDRATVRRTLLDLVEEVARRLRRAGLRGQVVHLKLRSADFTTVTRQETLAAPADTTDAIWPAAERLLAKADDGGQAIRLIGVSLSLFDGERQMPLFEPPNVERARRVARAVDTLVERFGPDVVGRGNTPRRRR
ncbi:MAG TPA: DNA polymerase IV [Candidatus Dormibacteraeota bacterium]|nr:DNA polymerase IV [Candidatus Dormibacteraeota bacterium]